MEHIVKLNEIIYRTHDVNSYRVEKPEAFEFEPGQATDFSLRKKGWEKEKRPFTFTSLPSNNYLELTIKSYDDHDGVTHQLRSAKPGDEFEISDPWGAISYKGKGIFIAGGAGITPFIAIFRHLRQQQQLNGNRLFFSNKTEQDIIIRDEFSEMLGDDFINIITRQKDSKFYQGKIDKDFLIKNITDFTQHFYVCGPDTFTAEIVKTLEELGANIDTVVFEK